RVSAVGDRLVGGLSPHLLAGVGLANQVDPSQRARELETSGSREAEVLAGGVPSLQVPLGDGPTKSRSGDATKGGGLPGRQDLLVGRCHLRFLHRAAMGMCTQQVAATYTPRWRTCVRVSQTVLIEVVRACLRILVNAVRRPV